MAKYKVKFANPDLPSKGFIDGYRTARRAKEVTAAFNAQFAKDGNKGICAEYLGCDCPTPHNPNLIDAAPDLLAALTNLVSDVLEYERINNLAPNPGKSDCWQSITQAKAAIAKATAA